MSGIPMSMPPMSMGGSGRGTATGGATDIGPVDPAASVGGDYDDVVAAVAPEGPASVVVARVVAAADTDAQAHSGAGGGGEGETQHDQELHRSPHDPLLASIALWR